MLENPLYKGTAHYKDNKVKNKDLGFDLKQYYSIKEGVFK